MKNTSNSKEHGFPSDAIESQLGYLQGEVLTLIEATIGDKEQKEATKQIIKSYFRKRIDWMNDISSNYSIEHTGENKFVKEVSYPSEVKGIDKT